MTSFDRIFFSQYVRDGSKIHYVFHRSLILILENVIVWLLLAVVIPAFLYYHNSFGIHDTISSQYIYIYLIGVYCFIMYFIFDWYNDVWLATENEIIDIHWRIITQDVLYIPYEKIEGIEVRTKNWWYALIGASDVVVKLNGEDSFVLPGASRAQKVVGYIKECANGKKKVEEVEDREPFEILVDTLTDVVRGSLGRREGEMLTQEYVQTLDERLSNDGTVDLRNEDDREMVDTWKKRHEKKKEEKAK